MLRVTISGSAPELKGLFVYLASLDDTQFEAVDQDQPQHHLTQPLTTAAPQQPAQQPQQPRRGGGRKPKAVQQQPAAAPATGGPFGGEQQQQQPAAAPATGGPFGGEQQQQPAAAPATGGADGSVPGIDAVQDAMSRMFAAGAGAKVAGLMNQFGAKKASDIPNERRADFIAAAEALL